MNHKMMLLATLSTFGLVACANGGGGSDNASASAAAIITINAIPSTVAPGGTSQITFTGGSGSYQNAYASQGTLVPQTATTWLYTAPAAPTTSTVTITVSDTLGTGGMGGLFITSSSTGTTPGTGTISTTSCAGSFALNVGGIGATLGVVQNVSGQISGFLYFPANSVNTQAYTFPIIGTCASGAINFQNVSLGQTYSGSYTNNGSSISVSGSVNTSAGTLGWSGSSTQVSPAPVAETQACGGQYSANIAGTAGTLVLVHNGGGGVAGYLSLPYQSTTNIYSISGTCGGTITLKNNTNGSTYTGTATFSGASVSMNGSFVTSGGQTYAWSATK